MRITMEKDVALQNAIDALNEAERAMDRADSRFTHMEEFTWAARRAEVWAAIGRGWSAVADNLPEERVAAVDDRSITVNLETFQVIRAVALDAVLRHRADTGNPIFITQTKIDLLDGLTLVVDEADGEWAVIARGTVDGSLESEPRAGLDLE